MTVVRRRGGVRVRRAAAGPAAATRVAATRAMRAAGSVFRNPAERAPVQKSWYRAATVDREWSLPRHRARERRRESDAVVEGGGRGEVGESEEVRVRKTEGTFREREPVWGCVGGRRGIVKEE